jgi:transcriptional regulator with XRE-family HTH domain
VFWKEIPVDFWCARQAHCDEPESLSSWCLQDKVVALLMDLRIAEQTFQANLVPTRYLKRCDPRQKSQGKRSAPLWQLRNYRMATTLAPVDSREVVRCDHCQLVQFRTTNQLCRRCKTSLDEEPEPVVLAPVAVATPQPMGSGNQIPVAMAIRMLRNRAGLSQRQLALRMRVPRTYVSKIENEKACPTLSSLERLATALHVRVRDLLTTTGRTLEDEIRELQSDEFIAELMPYMRQLNGMQLATVLNQVRELTVMPRRNVS